MHEQFLQHVIALASDNVASGQGGPYGAIIVKENQLIAASDNKITSTLDPTAHAEIVAIRQACLRLNDFQIHDCILYTSCEPCPMCLGAIYWARRAKVYYACSRFDAAAAHFDDSFIYDEILVPPSELSIAMHHLNLPNALQSFNIWAEKSDKVVY